MATCFIIDVLRYLFCSPLTFSNALYLSFLSVINNIDNIVDMNVPIIDEDAKEDRKKILVDYFTTNRHNHEFYAYRYIIIDEGPRVKQKKTS